MKKKMTAGFTLVELIVVIAILGILAGVGTVGYSGYIKKANMAADQQLLGYVNQAFAAACLENGKDAVSLRSGVGLDLNSDKTVDVDSLTPADYQDEFTKYYAGNESSAFKVATGLYFSDGMFKIAEDIALTFYGSQVSISSGDVAALKGSGFMSENIGIDGLTEKMNDVTDFAAEMLGSRADVQAILTKPAFLTFAGEALGMESTPTLTELQNYVGQLASETGVSADDITSRAMVLFAASQAASADRQGVKDMLTSGNAVGEIRALRDAGKNDEALTKAALAYGMYIAYAENNGQSATTDDPFTVLGHLNDEGFQKYLAEEQSNVDLEGFIGGLNMINGSAKTPEAVESLLTSSNGFQDTELVKILNDLLG